MIGGESMSAKQKSNTPLKLKQKKNRQRKCRGPYGDRRNHRRVRRNYRRTQTGESKGEIITFIDEKNF